MTSRNHQLKSGLKKNRNISQIAARENFAFKNQNLFKY